ncbi:uncharacterized protein [Triticum aestivum]|uniref:uncharacterized protein n=1 Tax=Triticum aestivum TaxID=4565 RepID=UPI001D02E20E|nr:uncharacterized protein LOC123138794 [Triticum aestivum]
MAAGWEASGREIGERNEKNKRKADFWAPTWQKRFGEDLLEARLEILLIPALSVASPSTVPSSPSPLATRFFDPVISDLATFLAPSSLSRRVEHEPDAPGVALPRPLHHSVEDRGGIAGSGAGALLEFGSRTGHIVQPYNAGNQVSFWWLEMEKRAADDHAANFLFTDKHSGMKVEGTLGCFHKSVLTMRCSRLSIDLVCNSVRAHLLVCLITFHVVSSMEFPMLYLCISMLMLRCYIYS